MGNKDQIRLEIDVVLLETIRGTLLHSRSPSSPLDWLWSGDMKYQTNAQLGAKNKP